MIFNINFLKTKKQKLALSLLFDLVHTEVLFGGGAGSGKSLLGCVWLIANCFKYPKTRWLMGRNTLKGLKESTLKTFFDIISKFDLKEAIKYNQNSNLITFFNESEILLKDLAYYPSDPNYDSLGSTEFTGAFIDECNEITYKCKEVVSSRLRYKLNEYNLIPKLLMTCNPAKNWVYHEFYKPYKDNTMPYYKAFIPALVSDNKFISPHYVESLKKLKDTATRERLLNGNWEYDDDPNKLFEYDDILDLFSNYIESSNEYFLSCDVARKGEDKTVLMAWRGLEVLEIQTYPKTKMNEVADLINAMRMKYKIPLSNVVIDEDGVGGGVVDLLDGCKGFIGGSSQINTGSKLLNYRNLRSQCYFKLSDLVKEKKIRINADPSVRDLIIQELEQIKDCGDASDRRLAIIPKDIIKDAIGRSPDYADVCFIAGTKILTPEGNKNIENLEIGDFVITPFGKQKIINTSQREDSDIWEYNGLIGTGSHKIYTNKGFKKLSSLTNYDKIEKYSLFNKFKWKIIKNVLSIMGLNIGFRTLVNITTGRGLRHYITKFGKSQTIKKFQKAFVSTILMGILLIIILKILNWLKGVIIREDICKKEYKIKNIWIFLKTKLMKLEKNQKNGMDQKKDFFGIKNIMRTLSQKLKNINIFVKTAKKNLKVQEERRFIIVVIHVINNFFIKIKNIMKIEHVLFAEIFSLFEKMKEQEPAQKNVEVSSLQKLEKRIVYNIEVEKDNVYYANNILVSNCMMRCLFELKQEIDIDFYSYFAKL